MSLFKAKYLPFVLFSIFYLFTAARIVIPGVEILRWFGSIIMVAYGIFERKHQIITTIIFSKAYRFLIVALIPTFLGIAGEGTLYSYGRIISFFLVCFGLEIYFSSSISSNTDIICCFKIFAFFSGLIIIYSLIFPNYINGRMTGMYQNANYFSCIAAFTMSATITLFFCDKSSNTIFRVFWLFISVLSAKCVIDSGSRIGLGQIVLLLFFIPFLFEAKRQRISYLKVLVAFFILFVLFAIVAKRYNFLALERFTLFENSNSGFSRSATWRDVYSIFSEKPLLGWGYGKVSYNVFINYDYHYHWGMHSSYFVTLCEMGLIGTVLVFLFFAKYYNESYIRFKNNKSKINIKDRMVILSLFFTSILILINAYSESFLFSVGNPMAICFWLPFILLHRFVLNIAEESTSQTESVKTE